MSASTQRANQFWNNNPPDWVVELARACDKSSQKKVGAVIGYSSSGINQVLGNRYPSDLTTFEKAVRGALMNVTVQCPVLDSIPANRCVEIQRRPYANTNQMRVQLFKACRQCQHNTTEGN